MYKPKFEKPKETMREEEGERLEKFKWKSSRTVRPDSSESIQSLKKNQDLMEAAEKLKELIQKDSRLAIDQ